MRLPSILRLIALLAAMLFATLTPLQAQFLPSGGDKKEETAPKDPLGRSTPRGTVDGYLNSIARDDFQRAGRYLEVPETSAGRPAASAADLASKLKQLLDRGGEFQDLVSISNTPDGVTAGDLDPDLEEVGRLDISNRNVPLLLRRIDAGDEGRIWLVANETLRQLPFLLATSRETLLDRILPEQLKTSTVASVSIGHWLAVGVLVFVCLAVGFLIARLILALAQQMFRERLAFLGDHVLRSIVIPLSVVIAVWLYRYVVGWVGIQVLARESINWILIIASVSSFAWLGLRIVDAVATATRSRMDRTNRLTSVAVVMLARRMVATAIYALAAIIILDLFGVDVTTGLAALGIGGLALALGAQKTVENLVGSVTVVADKPVRVGDFCAFGTTMGTVEDIGIRSTRLRTLDRTVVTIPNGAFASTEIENYSLRDRFKFETILNMRYETTPSQMRWLLVELRALLYGHDMVSNQPARVRLTGLGAHSMDITIFAYIETGDPHVFFEVQEDLLLRVLDIVKRSGSDFAFPSQTLYMGTDIGLDAELAGEIDRDVSAREQKGDLGMPRFSPEKIAELDGKIRFDRPPEADPTATVPEPTPKKRGRRAAKRMPPPDTPDG